MVINNGVWFVDVTICQSAHAQYGAASQFATEIGKISTLRMFAFSNRPPTQICRLSNIARDILCQCILNGIELIVTYIFADDGFQVSLRDFHTHGNFIRDNKTQWTTFQKFCLLQHFIPDAFALFVVILVCTFHHCKDSENLRIDKEFLSIFWMLQENYLSLPMVRREIRTNTTIRSARGNHCIERGGRCREIAVSFLRNAESRKVGKWTLSLFSVHEGRGKVRKGDICSISFLILYIIIIPFYIFILYYL